jgi:2-polyprenyl-6-methoxyphenol hydroxylase-like FAD-dependent oxidoreductase
MSPKLRVALVGGGLGGLCACLALTRNGIEAHVFEQADRLREIGAGIGLSANAVKVLREFGLENALRSRGFEPEATIGRDWMSGRTLFRTPLRDGSGIGLFGAPHIKIHRADLLDVLAATIPVGQIHLDSRCVGVSSSADRAVLTFADGRQEEADLVVGCDGIRSFVRAALHGPETPRFTGNMCWRALIPTERLPSRHVPPNMNIWTGAGRHVVAYHVRRGQLVNVVATRETKQWIEESWMVPGCRDELTTAFAGMHTDLRTILESVDQCFKWGLFDRAPLRVWSSQRITLLGDAAHPMLPSLGQGGAMAIEDAHILSRALSRYADDIPEALRAYEATRIPRAIQVQLASRAQSELFHQSTPRSTSFSVDWIYGYDPIRQPLEEKVGA